MSGDATFRPRLSRVERDRVLDAAESLTGERPSTFPSAIRVLGRYFDVLSDDLRGCPSCGCELSDETFGEMDYRDLPAGKWYCSECVEIVDVYDYLEVEDREQARIPALSN